MIFFLDSTWSPFLLIGSMLTIFVILLIYLTRRFVIYFLEKRKYFIKIGEQLNQSNIIIPKIESAEAKREVDLNSCKVEKLHGIYTQILHKDYITHEKCLKTVS